MFKRAKSKLYKLIISHRPTFRINQRVKSFLNNNINDLDYNQIPFGRDMENNMNLFLGKNELKDKEFCKKIEKDLTRCYLLYGITPDEYFMHQFQNKKDDYRSTILSRKLKDDLTVKYTGNQAWKYFGEIWDKWSFYNITKDFFKRDVCKIENDDDFLLFKNFCEKHKRFIAKPRKASSGIGVHFIEITSENSVEKIFEKYKSFEGGMWMFEEIVNQSSDMASWHPSSVNTIRIPSIMTSKGPEVILPLFRTGKNGNIVDNCHNDGGLMAVPDSKSGVLISDGYDIYTNVVKKHPNSGITFKGWQVPRWNELIEMSSLIHSQYLHHHKYIGFDFALTDNGWILIEANWGNFPHQVCVSHGIRKEFEELLSS